MTERETKIEEKGTARIALPVLGEGELDGGQGVTGFERADFGRRKSIVAPEGSTARYK
jgi:hypothetical protein